jgi:hypothetical protein
MPAAASRTSPLSREIGQIVTLVELNRSYGRLQLARGQTENLLRRLALIQRGIASIEHELGAFRAQEDGRAAAACLDDLAMDVMRDGVVDAAQAGEAVVFPDFSKGRGS